MSIVLIREIEKFGEELYGYSVNEDICNERDDEPIYESVWAGDAIVYDYAGSQYEIITWNENSKKHKEGDKTITQIK